MQAVAICKVARWIFTKSITTIDDYYRLIESIAAFHLPIFHALAFKLFLQMNTDSNGSQNWKLKLDVPHVYEVLQKSDTHPQSLTSKLLITCLAYPYTTVRISECVTPEMLLDCKPYFQDNPRLLSHTKYLPLFRGTPQLLWRWTSYCSMELEGE